MPGSLQDMPCSKRDDGPRAIQELKSGAHFVGLNAHSLPWTYYGRPATACIIENWERHKPQLYEAVGLSCPATVAE